MSEKQLLIDRFVFKPTLLEDNRATGGKVVVRGEFARANVATENKRVYPRTLWERELKRLEKQIHENKVFGELDHPMDGRTQLKRVSHLVTDLHMEADVVVGEAQLLDTAEGRNLRAIFEAGGQVGVSSRGFGTTRPNTEGMDVVQDDYRLMTFDFVAEPANVTSYPVVHMEDKAKGGSPLEAAMAEELTLDKLRSSNPALVESLTHEAELAYEKRAAEIWAKKISSAKQEAATDLRTEFAEKLQATLAEAKKEIEEQVRSQLTTDPSVAGAKKALDEVKALLRPYVIPEDVESLVRDKEKVIEDLQKKLADQELKLAKLTEENDKLAAIAKEAGYRYHLESLLHGVPEADLIRKVVGDVKQYESVDELNGRVAEIVEEIKKSEEKKTRRDEEMARLREENDKLRAATEKSLEAVKQLSVQAYVENRLANHPKSKQIRALFESAPPSTREDVDSILQQFREPVRDTHAIEEARARVRELVGSVTREALLEHEEQGARKDKPNGGANFNGLGVSLDSLRALSGIGTDNNN